MTCLVFQNNETFIDVLDQEFTFKHNHTDGYRLFLKEPYQEYEGVYVNKIIIKKFKEVESFIKAITLKNDEILVPLNNIAVIEKIL